MRLRRSRPTVNSTFVSITKLVPCKDTRCGTGSPRRAPQLYDYPGDAGSPQSDPKYPYPPKWRRQAVYVGDTLLDSELQRLVYAERLVYGCRLLFRSKTVPSLRQALASYFLINISNTTFTLRVLLRQFTYIRVWSYHPTYKG